MKVQVGPAEARRAKAGASTDSAEEMKDTRASALVGFINFFNSYMVSPYFI